MFPLRSNGLSSQPLRSIYKVMSRPPANDKDKRIHQVNIRLTREENEKANHYAQASGLSQANWIRQKVFTGKFPRIKLSPIETSLYQELKKIGINLNQGTHKLNQGDFTKDYLIVQMDLLGLLNKVLKVLLDDRQSDKR